MQTLLPVSAHAPEDALRREHFAVHRILASLDSPSWHEGAASRAADWKQRALGVALSLLREGHFEWEDFRHALQRQLGHLGGVAATSWQYCQHWALALESVIGLAGLVDAGALAELRDLAQHADHEALQQYALPQVG